MVGFQLGCKTPWFGFEQMEKKNETSDVSNKTIVVVWLVKSDTTRMDLQRDAGSSSGGSGLRLGGGRLTFYFDRC